MLSLKAFANLPVCELFATSERTGQIAKFSYAFDNRQYMPVKAVLAEFILATRALDRIRSTQGFDAEETERWFIIISILHGFSLRTGTDHEGT